MNWSGGKDAALSLYKIQQEKQYEITCLFTTVNEEYRRVSMHGVREALLHQQAKALNIPLEILYLDENIDLAGYNRALKEALNTFAADGISHAVFGDIFLEDLRKYREQQLLTVGMTGVFPLWKINTSQVINEFWDAGFKAIVTCVNARLLHKHFAGRIIDKDFIHDLPKGVDPCGEHGEFHSFVFDGPLFSKPLNFTIGEIVEKEYKVNSEDEKQWDNRFFFCDILPEGQNDLT